MVRAAICGEPELVVTAADEDRLGDVLEVDGCLRQGLGARRLEALPGRRQVAGWALLEVVGEGPIEEDACSGRPAGASERSTTADPGHARRR